MIYAEIVAGQIARYITASGPLPAHKLRPDLLPVVDVPPVFDPQTQIVTGTEDVVVNDHVERRPVIGVRPPEPVPDTITKVQFVRACVRAGLMTHAEGLAYLAQGTLPQLITRAIARLPAGVRADLTLKNVGGTTIERAEDLFTALVSGGQATDAQIDDLFRLAATLK